MNYDFLNDLGMEMEESVTLKDTSNNDEKQNTEVVEETPKDNEDTSNNDEKQNVEVVEGIPEDNEDTSNNHEEQNTEVVDEVSGDNEEISLFSMLGMEEPEKNKKKAKSSKEQPKSAGVKSAKKELKLQDDKLKIVKAYGQEVLTIEPGKKGDLEEIRDYLVNTLGFREFQKDDTEMIIINDQETQYIIPQPKFKAKG